MSAACAFALVACMFDLPLARDEVAGPDGSPDPIDAASDTARPPDAPPQPTKDAGAIDAPYLPCPEAGTVRVGQGATTFCVDATEVTDDQFLVFMSAGGLKGNGGVPPQCLWNAGGQQPVIASDSLPVVNVNWCDAYAYCAWAGKHLCGTPRGEWSAACSHDNDGQHAYPYGNTLDPLLCNAVGNGTLGGALAAVMSNGRCVGGYDGVYDMAGNAAEWEDACDDDGGLLPTGEDAPCNVRGGAFDEDPRVCAYVAQLTRQTRAADVGFRCCY